MPRDFTLDTYRLLLDVMESYEVLTVRRYLEERPKSGFIILRHDVDRFPKNALKMARLEASRNIFSTYYFRVSRRIEKNIIREIADLGHEVGYHYEVLSKANGDYEQAIRLFESELGCLRTVCDIKTISMHGKPLSKWDNSQLWNEHSFTPFRVIGDGMLSIRNVPYFTDAGRSWDGSNNLRDHLKDEKDIRGFNNTFQLLDNIIKHKNDFYYLNIHPERWASSITEYYISYFFDITANLVKKIYLRLQ
jgi:hypothetical protein